MWDSIKGFLFDPEKDKAYTTDMGISQAQLDQQRGQSLGQIGAILLAAGQGGPIGQRGQILSKLGDVGGDAQKNMLNMAQMQLYKQQVEEKKAAAAQRKAAQEYMANYLTKLGAPAAPTFNGQGGTLADTAHGGMGPDMPQAMVDKLPKTGPDLDMLARMGINPQMIPMIAATNASDPEKAQQMMFELQKEAMKRNEMDPHVIVTPNSERVLMYDKNAIKRGATDPLRVLQEGKVDPAEEDRMFQAIKSDENLKRWDRAAPAYESMLDAYHRNDRVADQALISSFVKIHDPDGSVMEGDVKNILNSQSLPDWFKGEVQRVSGGAGLSPEMRRQMIDVSRDRIGALHSSASSTRNNYLARAKERGFSMTGSIPDIGKPATPTYAIPQGAIDMLRKDPSPQAIAEFNSTFGRTAAARVGVR